LGQVILPRGGRPVPHGSFAVLCGALVQSVDKHLGRASEAYALALKGRAVPPSKLVEWGVLGADDIQLLWAVLAEHRARGPPPVADPLVVAGLRAARAMKRARVALEGRADLEGDAAKQIEDLGTELARERAAKRRLEGIAITAEGEQAWRDDEIAELRDELVLGGLREAEAAVPAGGRSAPSLNDLKTPTRQKVQSALTPRTLAAVNELLWEAWRPPPASRPARQPQEQSANRCVVM